MCPTFQVNKFYIGLTNTILETMSKSQCRIKNLIPLVWGEGVKHPFSYISDIDLNYSKFIIVIIDYNLLKY